MAKLPSIGSRTLCHALAQVGFEEQSSRGKGSHTFLFRADPPKVITVPKGELKRGTLRAILRQADLSIEDFLQLL